jgi:dihydrolipoamide dehydrogenase
VIAVDYDVVVIGAGPGGYVCAIRASQLGKKVAIVDKRWLGGVCLNIGCIPSKALLKNAEIAHTLRHRGKEFGFSFDNLQLDYGVAVKRSFRVAKRLSQGVGFLMRKNDVQVHMGTARLLSDSQVEVVAEDGTTTILTASNIVIATGAHPGVPPGLTVDGDRVVTYEEAIVQQHRPERVAIIGGGAIGVEFATIWNSYGTYVTIIEMLPRILPREDEEISQLLTNAFQKDGIDIMAGARVDALEVKGSEVGLQASWAGEKVERTVDQVLVAIGFVPNSKGLGLEELGIALDRRGNIQVDDGMRTNVPGIHAIGDVNGKLPLCHAAHAQGIVCAEIIAGHPTVVLDYAMMPRATYCHPQVTAFGYTETQAREAGYEPKTASFDFQANGKALGLGDYAGWVKIVTDTRRGEILGAHLIGPHVTELLPELTLAHNKELTIEDIARNVHAHPTLSEALLDAAHGLTGGYIHK